jgi:hypothetical protein
VLVRRQTHLCGWTAAKNATRVRLAARDTSCESRSAVDLRRKRDIVQPW